MNKKCSKCNLVKPIDDFHRMKAKYRHSHCKQCRSEHHSLRWKSDPEYRARQLEIAKQWRKRIPVQPGDGRKWDLKRKYGISIEEYDRLLQEQNNVCAICQNECLTGKHLAVDHNHITGEIRGLLCSNCNQGLGKFKDSPKLLKAAQEYLER